LTTADQAGFPWPPLEAGGPAPVWDGTRFCVGGETRLVLEYSRNESAWDASLTGLHEGSANSDHPIDLASRRAAVGALRSCLSTESTAILEVGTSSGFLLPLIRSAFPRSLVIGSDAFPESLNALALRTPGFPLLQFDLTRCPLPDACLDAVVALNVLEHIEDDTSALVQVCRILRPGGVAYVEVPAGAWLYDIYDEMLRHHRRYRASELAKVAQRAGLRVEWLSHLGFLVFPLFAAAKKRQQRLMLTSPADKRAQVVRNISASRRSRGLAMAFALEEWLARVVRFPFGIRCVSVLRKPV
jgi:SAM-dependent methyltransferase